MAQPQTPAPASPFVMQQPAAVTPLLASQAPAEDSQDRRKYGLLAMAPGSQHRLAIGGSTGLWTAKDRALYPNAKGFYFCTGCARTEQGYKSFANKTEMIAAHESPEMMKRKKEVHLFGFYSNDPMPKIQGAESAGAIGLLSGEEPTS